MSNKNSHLIIPQNLAIKSMRDSGYKNTAYALAELIDNSSQAIEVMTSLDGSHKGLIEVFVVEEREIVNTRERWRIKEIAVMDNGCGMDRDTLRRALQFGNGEHLNDRNGIGRFGMGLPNSSISQARRVDVWSRNMHSPQPQYSYLDVNDIESQKLVNVPDPTIKEVPNKWKVLSSNKDFSSGTLVIWSDLDRVQWQGAKKTLENTEFLIGRIYRKLIQNGLIIRLVAVKGNDIEYEKFTEANDPCYLMSPSNTPSPFDKKSMFRPWGMNGIQEFDIKFKGDVHKVRVLLSWASDEARIFDDGTDAGTKPWGQHAKKNIGVSIVRANRELILDPSWANGDTYRARWWGAEISFPPTLDEVFGVSNNKQSAIHMTDLAEYYQEDENDPEWNAIKETWRSENDPRVHLLEIYNYLRTQIKSIESRLRDQTKGIKEKRLRRHKESNVEPFVSRKFKERAQEGHDIPEDKTFPPEDVEKSLLQDLVKDKNYPENIARERVEIVTKDGLKVIFVTKDNSESPAFFAPESLPGVTEVVFNSSHPAFKNLIDVLEPKTENESIENLRDRICVASKTLRILLASWARYEMEEKEGPRRENVKSVRQEWGKMAKWFMHDLYDESSFEEDVP